MKPIQLILVPLIVILVSFYLRRIRTRVLDQIIVLCIGIVGIVLVVVPDWANTLAHFFGVGRGADLLIYLGLVGISYLLIMLYSKLRQTERRITELTRDAAMKHAQMPDTE